ncbi:MAG: cysteine-rich CWC family protein [Gammaproteobacteria bacterium]|nr:cysteine-rich CWC family protein [Gammaproteobacteria bacterium]
MSCRKDVTHCPVCGEENACYLVDSESPYDAGKKYPIEECWCAKVGGKLNRKLLAAPLDNSPTSCICQKCWEKYQEK